MILGHFQLLCIYNQPRCCVEFQMKNVCKQSETCQEISARINPQLPSQNWKSQKIHRFGRIFRFPCKISQFWEISNVLSQFKIKKTQSIQNLSHLVKLCVFCRVFWQFRTVDLKPTQNHENTRFLSYLDDFVSFLAIFWIFSFLQYIWNQPWCYEESHLTTFSKLS